MDGRFIEEDPPDIPVEGEACLVDAEAPPPWRVEAEAPPDCRVEAVAPPDLL